MSRKKSKPFSFLLIIFLLLFSTIGGLILWMYSGSRPVSSVDENYNFIVRTGDTVEPIGKRLEEAGLIRSSTIFKLIVMKNGIATKIQAGSFSLSPSMTTAEIANSLTTGRQDFWITIIPGTRREELAEQLDATFDSVGLSLNKNKFLQLTEGKEGMLYPETHLLPLNISEETLVSIILNTFNSNVDQDLKSAIQAKGYTLNQILTLASLIEREANDDASRKMVSGILHNRIDINMALQVDATLQYIKGYSFIHKDWWAPPLAADKKIDSPYNTYMYPGLPPGPICSPSLSSIKAALNPTPNDYLYYLTDNNLNMHYAKTFDAHNANINRYLR